MYRCYPLKKDSDLFYKAMLKALPALSHLIGDLEEAKKEKNIALRNMLRVGGILMDYSTQRFLVVQDATRHSFMFPRGKINKQESTMSCLRRELKEELEVRSGVQGEAHRWRRVVAHVLSDRIVQDGAFAHQLQRGD